jgi:ABC-type microcin C transport system duplicated ATPase subunit YejF
MAEPLISLSGVRREFPAGEQTIAVLKDINLTIEAGEMVAIVGASAAAARANWIRTNWPNCAASISASSSSAITCCPT